MSDLVLGTAGHVDHGKTSLVRALTGVDLDSLPEERARGITITLGFVPLALPDGRTAGLVDVPGHEKLVRTMVSGATGLDAAMLCVSAVEGVMPQTREHLDVLALLQVPKLVAVLTMADQVDSELLELAEDELRSVLLQTPWADAPIIATSAVTRRGLDELVAALAALPSSGRDLGAPFRMPVDRAFVRRGFGTVVTGTAWAGRLADGSEVELAPGAARARVRGIQVHGAAVAEAHAGSRTALNLTGVELDDLGRGVWVCAPGVVPDARVIDARYRHLATAPALGGQASITVLHGTREVTGRMLLIDVDMLEAGTECLVQLHLAEPLPCLPGDRFVVRRTSPATTLGGGAVLDPWAPVLRRRRLAEAAEELRRLEQGDTGVFLERAGTDGLTEPDTLGRVGRAIGTRLGERRYADAALRTFREALAVGLADRHRAEPLAPALNRKAAWLGPLRALDERAFLAFLESEAAARRVVVEGGRVRLPAWQVQLDVAQQAWCASLLQAAGHAALEGFDAPSDRADRDSLLFLLRDRGEIDLVGGRVYTRAHLEGLRGAVLAFFQTHSALDPGAFKELTGQSRRTAIPLLEWLDASGVTRRVGDARVRA